MTAVLMDHNIEGQAALILATLSADGWLELLPLEVVTFTDVGLSVDSPDRVVWRFVQTRGMLLLTNNRNAKGVDSLGRTMSEETTRTSLPVLTVGDPDRIVEREYRVRCAERIVDIVLDLGRYLGVGRIFIP